MEKKEPKVFKIKLYKLEIEMQNMSQKIVLLIAAGLFILAMARAYYWIKSVQKEQEVIEEKVDKLADKVAFGEEDFNEDE
jgi:hypothetical protein